MRYANVEQTLKDVHDVCTNNNIRYFVIGSAAFTAVAGKYYRLIYDIDFLYDAGKKEILRKELTRLGYTLSLHSYPLKVFLEPLERYKKNNQIIEPRAGNFINGNFVVNLRSSFKLILTKTMIIPK